MAAKAALSQQFGPFTGEKWARLAQVWTADDDGEQEFVALCDFLRVPIDVLVEVAAAKRALSSVENLLVWHAQGAPVHPKRLEAARSLVDGVIGGP